MEELNLVEILKDCPKDYKLYSPVFGNVRLLEVFTDCENPSFVIATGYPPMPMIRFSPNGKLTKDGEAIAHTDLTEWDVVTVLARADQKYINAEVIAFTTVVIFFDRTCRYVVVICTIVANKCIDSFFCP